MATCTSLCITQLTQIHEKNNPSKFHPDPIWNDVALGFFEERRPNNNDITSHETRLLYANYNIK